MNYQNFLNKIDQPDFNGFNFCQGEQLPDDLPASENEYYGRLWEFRISVTPEKNNLKKAAKAIAEQLHAANVHFKCLLLNHDVTSSIFLEKWDGTKLQQGPFLDRDQRGKEICIYMTYGQNGCIKSPAEWKQLMIECWKALKDAQVDIGYSHLPLGDKAIAAEVGVTPFSYTSFKQFNNRHGILLSTDYNPNNYVDPLENVLFTADDLKRHGLETHACQMQLNRLNYTKNHFFKASVSLYEHLKKYKNNQTSLSQCFRKLIETLLSDDCNQQTVISLCKTIVDQYPKIEATDLKPHELIELLDYMVGNSHFSFNKGQYLSTIQSLFNDYEQLKINIKSDFLQHKDIKDFLDHNQVSESDLDKLIDNQPAQMQKYFRQLYFLQYEKNALLMQINTISESRKSVALQIDEARQAIHRSQDFINYGILGLALIITLPFGIALIITGWYLKSKNNLLLEQLSCQRAQLESIGDINELTQTVSQYHFNLYCSENQSAQSNPYEKSIEKRSGFRDNKSSIDISQLLSKQGFLGNSVDAPQKSPNTLDAQKNEVSMCSITH